MNQIWVGNTAASNLDTVSKILQDALANEQSLTDFEPFYVVTPTATLSDFYTAELAHRDLDFGVNVCTLYGFAAKILNHNAQKTFRESPIFSIIVKEAVDALSGFPEVAALQQVVHGFDDGLAALVRSIKDLFIASFVPEQLEPILELLREPRELSLKSQFQSIPESLNGLSRERACAVVRVAAFVYQHMIAINGSDADFGLRESVMWQAAECLRDPQNSFPPAKGVVIVGLVDATGMVNTFLEVLSAQQSVPIQLIFQRALDTIDPQKGDASNIVVDGYFERQFLSSLPIKRVEGTVCAHQTRTLRIAPSRQAELRAVFKDIQATCHENPKVEHHRIAIVARDLRDYLPFLEQEAERLAIPIQVSSKVKVPTYDSCQLNLLMQFWADQENLSLIHFLQIATDYCKRLQAHDLIPEDILLFCRCYGLQKCVDLPQVFNINLLKHPARCLQELGLQELGTEGTINSGVMALSQWSFPERQVWYTQNLRDEKGQDLLIKTPFITHIELSTADDGQQTPTRRRRAIPMWLFIELLVSVRLGLSPIELQLQNHTRFSVVDFVSLGRSSLTNLRGDDLDLLAQIVLAELESLTLSMVQERQIDWGGWLHILGQMLHGSRTETIGADYGIQVLSAPEALGQTFEHLYLIGLNQGIFPEQYAQDALINDGIRNVLLDLLPDISIRSSKGMVERHLFCSLYWSTDRLWLSWLRQDEQGNQLNPSTLISRLLLNDTTAEVLPDIYHLPKRDDWADYSVEDWAVLNGLYGEMWVHGEQRPGLLGLYELVWQNTADPETGLKYAKHRFETIQELSHGRLKSSSILEHLGPMGGLTGQLPYLGRQELETGLYVTSIEGHISCPWKHFLTRQLGLVDVDEENIGLPNFPANTLGSVVHEYLEDWVNHFKKNDVSQNNIAERLTEGVFSAYWHEDVRSTSRGVDHDALLSRVVSNNLNAAGQIFEGTFEAATQEAEHILNVFRDTLQNDTLPFVLGVELDGMCRLDVNHQSFESCFSKQEPHIDESYSTIQVLFKADRVDYNPNTAELSIVDYKTGQYWGKATIDGDEDESLFLSNRIMLVNQILQGRMLQPIAYVASSEFYRSEIPEMTVSGELLYLNTERYPMSGRTFQLAELLTDYKKEKELFNIAIKGFGAAALSTLISRKEGLNFPRAIKMSAKKIIEESERNIFDGPHFASPESAEDFGLSKWCSRCEVRSACRFGDSSFHGRLKSAMLKTPEHNIERHLYKVWSIGHHEKGK